MWGKTNPSYLVHPGARAWAEAAHRAGIRASAALPIEDSGGEPAVVLALYGRWPGQFEPEPTRVFLQALRQVFNQAYVEFGRRTREQAIAEPVRRQHLQLLSHGTVHWLYQPIVDLRSGKPTQVEALARLGDSGHAIPPGEFLAGFGRAELERLFVLGLRAGLDQLRTWDAQGIALDLTLNLPPSVLVHTDCGAWISQALERSGIAPRRLGLELLEDEGSSATELRDVAIERLDHLGVRLIMDDFGSGYSNLWRLRVLPFKAVKFDRQLLCRIGEDDGTRCAFLAALLGVPESLGLRTVLEGLETPELVALARKLGADAGQGYALAPPLAADAIPDWCRGFTLPTAPLPSDWKAVGNARAIRSA